MEALQSEPGQIFRSIEVELACRELDRRSLIAMLLKDASGALVSAQVQEFGKEVF